ncbi:type III pantothenate kinase [Alteromonas sp. H39]|uniref:type III pantothenate kinase n=1 Tax=Alteromonas sp. H39 TaxID=3389876 RepID=UPI0039DF3C01
MAERLVYVVNDEEIFLVDIGNTRIKYCALPDADNEPIAVGTIEALYEPLTRAGCKLIYVASVREEAAVDALRQIVEGKNIRLEVVNTEKSAFGITNSYENPATMGVDRWLAMIAGAGMTKKKAFCVIDVGTAITTDFVFNGQHLGGWITPGFHSMRNGLINSTKRVFGDESVPDKLQPGISTQMCVANGCLAAVQGVFLSAIAYLNSKQTDFDVILGGGDKKLFAFPESGGSILAANLVVQGLARYAKREIS